MIWICMLVTGTGKFLIFTTHQPGSSNQVEENKATEAEARDHYTPDN